VATWQVWLTGLGTITAMMVVTWVISVVRKDASIVDRVWGLAFVVGAWTYATTPTRRPRAPGWCWHW
jgi:steroid 5-alpha reductase family enzyme